MKAARLPGQHRRPRGTLGAQAPALSSNEAIAAVMQTTPISFSATGSF